MFVAAGRPPTTRRLGGADLALGLAREFVSALGLALLRILTDYVLFPDGPLFAKLRGRVYSLLFGWERGVGVARGITLERVRQIRVGAYTRIQRQSILKGPIEIGRHCFIGERNVVYPGTVIEDRVSTGPLVYLITSWHPIGPSSQRAGPVAVRPVRIGSGACLNTGAIVLPGCNVGPGAIVAAGTKVTRSVPANTFVAGNPAQVAHRFEDSP